MKRKILISACGLFMISCGSEKSNKAETAVDSEKLAEYQSLPQGMIVRVPVDSDGNMQTSDLEVRDYNGQAIDQNNVSDLQNYYSSAPISSTYGQRAIDASLGNVTVINPPAKSFLGAPSQYPGQIPGGKGGKGAPGQYPGQIPGKTGPGQYPGQIPGKQVPDSIQDKFLDSIQVNTQAKFLEKQVLDRCHMHMETTITTMTACTTHKLIQA